jgi:hypothetical protein
MCEILEVNMENMQKVGLSEEQVKGLFGVFDSFLGGCGVVLCIPGRGVD